MQLINLEEVGPLLAQAKAIALEYYRITGKPLGITGEVGEYEAAKRLNLTLVEARTPVMTRYGRAREYKSKLGPLPIFGAWAGKRSARSKRKMPDYGMPWYWFCWI